MGINVRLLGGIMNFKTNVKDAIKATNERLKRLSRAMNIAIAKKNELDQVISDYQSEISEIDERILFLERLRQKGIISFAIWVKNSPFLIMDDAPKEVIYVMLNIQNELRTIAALNDEEVPHAIIEYINELDDNIAEAKTIAKRQ